MKHACYCYQPLTVVTAAGDFLALTSGWPGKVHELDALDHAAFLPALVTSKVLTLADRGLRGTPARTGARVSLPVGRWSKRHDLPETVQAYNYRQNSTRADAEHAMAALKHWGILRFTKFSIVRFVDTAKAVANIISLLHYGHRAAS